MAEIKDGPAAQHSAICAGCGNIELAKSGAECDVMQM
jgi:hypothetical protein